MTIILVSHSTEEIRRLCDRVIWLESGKIVKDGEPDPIIDLYEKSQALL
jgi:lipopolysaccharide transport system ATP-binding protein